MTSTNEVQVMEDVAVEAAKTGLTNGQKVGLIVAATVLSGGVAYGVIRLVKHFKNRKANQSANNPTESHD